MYLHWPHDEVWVLCRACKLSMVQPGLPSQYPLQLLPVHPSPATPDYSEVSKASGYSMPLCLGIFLFSLCEILCFHAPSPVSWTTLTHPLRLIHIPLSSRLVWYSPSRIFHYFLCSLPAPPLPTIITFSQNTKGLLISYCLNSHYTNNNHLYLQKHLPLNHYVSRFMLRKLHRCQWKQLSCPWTLQEGMVCQIQVKLCRAFGLNLVCLVYLLICG